MRSPFRGWKYNWDKQKTEWCLVALACIWHVAGFVMTMFLCMDHTNGELQAPWWACVLTSMVGIPTLWIGGCVLIYDALSSIRIPHISPPFVREVHDEESV